MKLRSGSGLAALTACGVAAALTGAAPAVAAQPIKLTMSYAEKTVDFMPFLVAQDAGIFKKHGIDATVRYLPAQQGIPALVSKQVQVVGIGGSDAVSAEAQGLKLKLVETLTPTYIFQFWAHPQYPNAKALKGQRVGITSTTGSLYAATLLALKQLGLSPHDVAITPLGSVTNVNSSMLAGSIAAAASHPPATFQFKKAGFIDLVDLAQKKIPSVSSGVWFSADYVKNNPKVVQKVVDSIAETLKFEESHKNFTEKEITKFLGVKNKAQLDFTYDFYTKEVLPIGPVPTVAELQGNKDALLSGNPKLASINVADMIDTSFIKKAKR